jgi:hypothetical protein
MIRPFPKARGGAGIVDEGQSLWQPEVSRPSIEINPVDLLNSP